MVRTLGCFALSMVFAVGCSASADDAVGADEGEINVRPTTEVAELDALVSGINGYASADAWTVTHARDFTDTLDERFFTLDDAARCTKGLNESTLRAVTRDRAGANAIRKLGLTSSTHEGNVSVTTHESYHYDTTGHLRVVVIDREEDHLLDDAYMAKITTEDLRVKAEADKLPMGTEAEKVARANKLFELRDSTRVLQYRLYYRTDGTLFHETKTEGLEAARALDFTAVSQTPPSLYGTVHPANVTGAPFLTRLFPTPDYDFRTLTTTNVPAGASMRAKLLAAKPSDAEASLAAKPVCR